MKNTFEILTVSVMLLKGKAPRITVSSMREYHVRLEIFSIITLYKRVG